MSSYNRNLTGVKLIPNEVILIHQAVMENNIPSLEALFQQTYAKDCLFILVVDSEFEVVHSLNKMPLNLDIKVCN